MSSVSRTIARYPPDTRRDGRNVTKPIAAPISIAAGIVIQSGKPSLSASSADVYAPTA